MTHSLAEEFRGIPAVQELALWRGQIERFEELVADDFSADTSANWQKVDGDDTFTHRLNFSSHQLMS